VLAFLGMPPHDWSGPFPRVLAGSYEEPADEAVLRRLRDFYAEPNRRLYELAGRDLGW
jgi:hypothetical protein